MARPPSLAPSRLLLGLSLALGTLVPGCAPPAAPNSAPPAGPNGAPRSLTAQQVPDSTFGQNGVVTTDLLERVDEIAQRAVVMADGRIVVAGSAGGGVVTRYLADGTLDPTFGTGGYTLLGPNPLIGLGVLSDGRIVVTGASDTDDIQVFRLLSDGTPDQSFGLGGSITVNLGGRDTPVDLVVQGDGRIVVAAISYDVPTSAFTLLRLSAAGQLDTAFGQNGTVQTPLRGSGGAQRLRLDAQGRLIVGGSDFFQVAGESRIYAVVARYLTNGTLDSTFGQDGVAYPFAGGPVLALDIQADGRIVIGGVFDDIGFTVARLDAAGTPDWTFGGGTGRADAGASFGGGGLAGLIVRRNGKILAAGTTNYSFSGPARPAWGLAQFEANGQLDTAFGDQGRLTVLTGPGMVRDVTLQSDGRSLIVGGLDPTACTSRCGGLLQLGLARFTPTDGDAATPPADPTPLPPLSAPLTVTASGQSSSTTGAALTVPVGSQPVIETTLGSAVISQRLAGGLSAQSIAPGTPLTGAEVYLDGVGWSPMSAVDGAFDSPSEAVRATLPALTQTGQRTVCVRAVSGLDRSAAGCAPLTVTASYRFGGFLRPVDNLPTVNTVKAGAAIPVKFSLGGNFGLNVLASGSPASAAITCDPNALVDPVEQTVTASSSGLQYDPVSGTYTYVWKTDRAWGGSCRQFNLTFADGTVASARFKFSR